VSGAPLAGKRIVVTRPEREAEGLAALIRDAGGEALCVPALEIRELADLSAFHAVADRLESFDLAIFVSRNAVRGALALLRERRGTKPWPARLRPAAIGPGSRAELEAHGLSGVLAPADGADSEALLALPELAAVAGKRVVIFRGEGGRKLLGESLAVRGAHVEHAPCYRRAAPEAGARLRAAWSGGPVDAVTVSSAEALANLARMLEQAGLPRLGDIPLFVSHARVAREAPAAGARRTIVAGPADAEMLASLVAYFGDAS
jgi:uroporphyrinogen-III synthase